MLRTLNDSTFDATLAQDGDYLISFSAVNWCAPCKALHPKLEAIARDYNGVLNVFEIDNDTSPRVFKRCGITALPTVFFFQTRGGKIVSQHKIPNAATTAKHDADIRAFLRSAMGR